MNAASHCLELVRSADKDRFLASLFAPDAKRAALVALYAFNIEIARVRRSVSEPALGEIRYQWWRDTIGAIYRGETSPHPVAQELAHAIKEGNLPENALLGLITAREFDLYDDPMPDVAALEG
ncbi:MAG TPA: squalene/phytoene synthase family protein, partial [Aestuariivirga sp.]|nr:squalene/phytoene synthase family protein [Aestuariivirga sp.]